MSLADTKSQLLSEAEALVRTVGFAAFSYGDLAERVGIRKASIHYHFPTKEILGTALVTGYLERFVADLDSLAEKPLDAKSKLLAYGEFFVAGLKDGLMPLCGALAADSAGLPVSMQQLVKKFFKLHLDWLERILRDGQARRELRADLKPGPSAQFLLSTLQGASLVAWALKDPTVIRPVFKQALETLVSEDA